MSKRKPGEAFGNKLPNRRPSWIVDDFSSNNPNDDIDITMDGSDSDSESHNRACPELPTQPCHLDISAELFPLDEEETLTLLEGNKGRSPAKSDVEICSPGSSPPKPDSQCINEDNSSDATLSGLSPVRKKSPLRRKPFKFKRKPSEVFEIDEDSGSDFGDQPHCSKWLKEEIVDDGLNELATFKSRKKEMTSLDDDVTIESADGVVLNWPKREHTDDIAEFDDVITPANMTSCKPVPEVMIELADDPDFFAKWLQHEPDIDEFDDVIVPGSKQFMNDVTQVKQELFSHPESDSVEIDNTQERSTSPGIHINQFSSQDLNLSRLTPRASTPTKVNQPDDKDDSGYKKVKFQSNGLADRLRRLVKREQTELTLCRHRALVKGGGEVGAEKCRNVVVRRKEVDAGLVVANCEIEGGGEVCVLFRERDVGLVEGCRVKVIPPWRTMELGDGRKVVLCSFYAIMDSDSK